ncbi:MAG: peptidoglycan DD-metalloendopeptidase family protein [Oscillospiraceae bacterium]|nr:peptidoglycan DD-metalloendopeptidase family protein [Oscillospiraceae bacterium]
MEKKQPKDYFEESSRLFNNRVLLWKKELKGYEYYRFLITGNNICKRCSELDGKVFKISDAAAGKNFPPLHPNCKCEIETVDGDYNGKSYPAKPQRPVKEKIPAIAKPTSNMKFGNCVFHCDCGAHGTRDDGSIILHSGVDLLPETRGTNDPVYAVMGGTVKDISGTSTGTAVSITSLDGNTVTTYLHLNEMFVEDGDVVDAGIQIGTMGNTGLSDGVHLHFGVTHNNVLQNPREFFNW